MELLVFGVNHRTAPVDVRERWALSLEDSRAFLERARGEIRPAEHLILSTCNRTEFYSRMPVAKSPLRNRQDPHEQRSALVDFWYRGEHPGPPGDLEHFYLYRERAAVEHLFRLAGGLDSMIVGESEILRQIKDAYTVSREARAAGNVFHRLFPAALNTGKRVRTLTDISKGCITPGQAALQLARQSLGDLRDIPVLLVGSGKIATLTARALLDAGIRRFEVVNRTPEKAREMARNLVPSACPSGNGGVPEPHVDIRGPDRLAEGLMQAGLVVTSTGSTTPLIDRRLLADVQARRDHTPLVMVDLAIPRDVAPAAAEVDGVTLHNIDDLNQVIQENIAERHKHIPSAEKIVREQLHAFVGRMAYFLQVDPVIRHMYERFEEIRLGELQAAIDAFPPEQHEQLDRITRSLVAKLLHFPVSRLKALRDLGGLSDEEVAFLKKLFPTDPS